MMKKIAVSVFAIMFLSVPASFTALAQLKIVCIGNSITQGKTGLKKDSSYEFSYRPWLWKKLVEAGLKVDMVGYHPYFFDEKEGALSMKFEVNGVPFDRDCEAYYGITSTGFVHGSTSPGWTGAPLPKFTDRINDAKRGYTPDVALIHMGTNDPDSTEALVAITRDNISEIVRVLRNKNPHVVVIVAKLITGWKKINTKVDALCQELNTAQSPVAAVDMATGFINDPKAAGTMTYDHVHPNNKGQLFMMEKWYSAILQNLNDREPPLLRGKPVVTERRDSATVSWTAGDDNYGIKSYQIFVNGKRVKTTNQTTFTYRLAAIRNSRPFKVSVRAADWSGNYSKLIWAEAKRKR